MIWIGTSGFQYDEWKGRFYPERLSKPKMLQFYAEHFPTTEINYTFRQIPSDSTIARWVEQTPTQFRFTLKVLERITHHQRLKGSEALLATFAEAALKFGPKLGTLLFQLPPQFKCDTGVLNEFLFSFPRGIVPAFEFRHDSWFTDAVFDTLRKHKATLCIADTDDLQTPVQFTGPTGYLRLRRVNYTEKDLRQWAEDIRAQAPKLKDLYVYFKHEEAGTGPRLGKQLMEMLGLKETTAPKSEGELPLDC